MPIGPRPRVLLIAATLFAALGALVWYLSVSYWSQPVRPLAPPSANGANEAVTPSPAPAATTTTTPATPATPGADATPQEAPATPESPPPPVPPASPSPQARGLAEGDTAALLASMRPLIPVQGVRPEQLQDTFSDSRSEGRIHDAIDIIAARGTPVVASVDGRVVRLFRSVRGGITVYQLASADERLVFYYAHLERYADGLAEGRVARRGETIGYVGDSGNATPGNTHLHFQIYRVQDPKRFWTGENINPYTVLRGVQ